MKKCCGTCGRWHPNVYHHIPLDLDLLEEEGKCKGFGGSTIITRNNGGCESRWKEADPWDLDMRERRGLIAKESLPGFLAQLRDAFTTAWRKHICDMGTDDFFVPEPPSVAQDKRERLGGAPGLPRGLRAKLKAKYAGDSVLLHRAEDSDRDLA